MFAFNTATLLLFLGLGLVALALGLLVRRYSLPAFVVGLAGLLTLATAATWLRTSDDIADGGELAKLRTENAKLSATLAESMAERQSAPTRPTETKPVPAPAPDRQPEIDRLEDQLRAERAKRTEADHRIAELSAKVRDVLQGKAEAEDRAASLEKEIGALPPPLPPQVPPDADVIRRSLANGDPRFYATRTERELIVGRKGTWYAVRLMQKGKEWSFADRQFTLPDAAEIKESASHLRDEVLVPLSKAGKRWQLFVRGTADARRVSGPVGRQLLVLPRLPDGTHSPDAKGKQVTLPVQNEDLPTLRAEGLRDIVRSVLAETAATTIEVLENPPRPEDGRTAELVLFVEW